MSRKIKESHQKQKESIETILKSFKKNIFGVEYYFNKFEALAQGEDVDSKRRAVDYMALCFREMGIDLNASTDGNPPFEFSNAQITELFLKFQTSP